MYSLLESPTEVQKWRDYVGSFLNQNNWRRTYSFGKLSAQKSAFS